jgi:drug/metabolite transporter (DMT)-like permease
VTTERSAARGYALAASAAALWALHGSLSRYLLDDGVDAYQLSELRSGGSFLILLAVLALWRAPLLRVERADVALFAFLGIAGLALVHAAYYTAIDHLNVGPALTIQYLAPLIVLLWLWLFHGRRLQPSLWGALALSVLGCFLVVKAYDYDALDGYGVGAALVSAFAFAIYMVSSERAGQHYPAATTLVWGFGFATLFWTFAQPWWSFPWDVVSTPRNALLGAAVILAGTLVPFLLMVTALRHIPAPRAAIIATLEPVLGAMFEWFIRGTKLDAVQIAGGFAVVAAVIWVQSQSPDLQQESAPALREAR